MNSQPAPQPVVVLVDDDRSLCALTRGWLQKSGYDVRVMHDGASCLVDMRQTLPDVICLDLNMPGLGGLETLRQIKEHYPLVPVIMLTAETAIESVVSSMQLGAYDYLTKPIDRTRLETAIKNAVDRHSLSMRLSQLEREASGEGYAGIVGESAPMKQLFLQMDRIVSSDITVLINGESGTGKELVARAIHEHSGRRRHAFVAVNCSAIPETLQESELFGHEKGAFTGATNRRIGKFEQAHGGTLFLDEVAELNSQLQAKLLRVLQERSFQRVGGSSEITSDFRLIAATHKNLEELVREGAFREDLYFRIAVFELALPPLRERTGDIPLLAAKQLEELNRSERRKVEMTPEAVEVLSSYSWPGNVRELHNAIQRAWVAADDNFIRPAKLPARVLRETDRETPPVPDDQQGLAGLTLEELERRAIATALEQAHGNLSLACRRLGIGRATIYRKIKKYNLRVESRS